jgi:hypothetical protein
VTAPHAELLAAHAAELLALAVTVAEDFEILARTLLDPAARQSYRDRAEGARAAIAAMRAHVGTVDGAGR